MQPYSIALEKSYDVAAFIGELQHYKNFKPLYLSTGKWAMNPFLSDQVTYGLDPPTFTKIVHLLQGHLMAM